MLLLHQPATIEPLLGERSTLGMRHSFWPLPLELSLLIARRPMQTGMPTELVHGLMQTSRATQLPGRQTNQLHSHPRTQKCMKTAPSDAR